VKSTVYVFQTVLIVLLARFILQKRMLKVECVCRSPLTGSPGQKKPAQDARHVHQYAGGQGSTRAEHPPWLACSAHLPPCCAHPPPQRCPGTSKLASNAMLASFNSKVTRGKDAGFSMAAKTVKRYTTLYAKPPPRYPHHPESLSGVFTTPLWYPPLIISTLQKRNILYPVIPARSRT
jgi:hypothetical protein